MRLNLICGFLGSGKTTLVRRILRERAGRERMAVIVNEFGEVGIDGEVLRGHSVNMIEISSGCLCCTLRGSLISAVEELRDKVGAERVVVESTGVAQPGELVETLGDPVLRGTVTLGPIVTIVDVAKFPAFRKVLGPFYTAQVERADVLLLNKTDLAGPERLATVRREVAALNPRATLVATKRCEVDLGLIMDAVGGNAEPSALEQGLAAPAPAASFVSLVVGVAFGADRAKVERFFAALSVNVIRAKGFMNIDGEPTLVQFAAGELEITPAAVPRAFNMVFIGHELNEPALRAGIAETARG